MRSTPFFPRKVPCTSSFFSKLNVSSAVGLHAVRESRKPSGHDDRRDLAAGEGTSVCALMRNPGSREGARIFDVGEPQSRSEQFRAGLARLQYLRFSRGTLAWRKKNSPARFKVNTAVQLECTGVHFAWCPRVPGGGRQHGNSRVAFCHVFRLLPVTCGSPRHGEEGRALLGRGARR